MSTIRWGIAGTGRIAEVVSGEFIHVPRADVVAVGSRSQYRAEQFAQTHGIARAHGSYRALVEDDEIDIIYIATPHPQHKQLALAAIEAGKAVLVEKAFTATLAGAREVVSAARAAGVFAMEAMWSRFQPAIEAAKEVIAWGRIGDIMHIQADLLAFREFDEKDRLFDKELGGGATLDLGVYLINLTEFFLGPAASIKATGRLLPNGVDSSACYQLTYASGASASLACGFDAHGPGRMIIAGDKGWIEIDPRFHHPRSISIHRDGVLPRIIDVPATGKGYAHELIEVNSCLLEGECESNVMPLDSTLHIMSLLEDCLTQLGVSYEEDENVI